MPEKITIFVAIWIIIMLFVSGDAGLEIFIILIFIGLLIAKELTDRFTTLQIKRRMNVFISVFLLFFVVAVTTKIMDFVFIN
jgi:hypothetical protein